MNKTVLIKFLTMFFKICFKIFTFTLKLIVTVLLSSDLDKEIKKGEQWENDYDEHTAEVTGRKFLF